MRTCTSNIIRKVFTVLFLQLLFVNSVFSATLFNKQLEAAYQSWCDTIGTARGDASQMLRFYAPHAILLPTLSAKILTNDNSGGMKKYFTTLTSYKNIKCVPEKLITRMYDNVAVNTGTYEFRFQDEHGKERYVPARFTFVYLKTGENWLIVNHHSSILP